MKSQSLEVLQPVAVIFKLFPADFWLLQEVWYQGHLPECACCVATWWERILRGMLQLTIQLPPRLVVTVFIQLAKLVDVVPIHHARMIMAPYLPSLLHRPTSPICPAFLHSSLTSDPLSLLPPSLLILSFTLPLFLTPLYLPPSFSCISSLSLFFFPPSLHFPFFSLQVSTTL